MNPIRDHLDGETLVEEVNVPRTEAGRRLLDHIPATEAVHPRWLWALVLDVEAEAAAAYRARLRERVEGLPKTYEDGLRIGPDGMRALVLALIDDHQTEAGRPRREAAGRQIRETEEKR